MKGNFQVIVIAIFIAAAVFGVLVFSGVIPIGEDESQGRGTVVLWGTVPANLLSDLLEEFNQLHPSFTLQYAQKFPETFNQDLLEALASGEGPDLFFLPDDLAYGYRNKIFTIPYESFPISAFKNTFAGAGEVFLTSSGILALPLVIDPMMMYYNRSMLDASGVVYPPVDWAEVTELVPVLTKKDETNKIIKSAVALGQFSNIDHAKSIITGLFMQAGNNIVGTRDGAFISQLEDNRLSLYPAIQFYTDFADPLKEVYSWNKGMPPSREAFSREDLALYFGYASELQTMISRNPNQNFLAAPFPQVKSASFKVTPARVTGIAISRFSKNFNTAFIAASDMATGSFAEKFGVALKIPPARRDLLGRKPTDAYFPVFYSSALYGRSWLDPSPQDTDNIFRSMVEKILSNNMTPEDALVDASAKLHLLLTK